MKVCSKCKIEKDESEFNKNKSTKSGLSRYCKECRKINKYKEHQKEYQKSNKYKEYRKKYRSTEEYKKYQNNCLNTIKNILGLKNIPINQIPPELIELKKLQLKIKRELKNGVQSENKN